jgi:hypothetical protein
MLDGRFGINIITYDRRNKLELPTFRLFPNILKTTNSTFTKPIGLIKFHIQNIPYIVIFTITWKIISWMPCTPCCLAICGCGLLKLPIIGIII